MENGEKTGGEPEHGIRQPVFLRSALPWLYICTAMLATPLREPAKSV